MTKKLFLTATAVTFLLALVLAFLPGQSAEAADAVKVQHKQKYADGKQYGVIKGLDSSGKTVWTYKTSKQEATELDSTSVITKGSFVYIIDNKSYIRLKKSTGKVAVKKNLKISDSTWSAALQVDSDKNLYAIGYYGSTLYKISKDGKLLWKHAFPTEYYWPTKIKVSGGKVTVSFDGDGNAFTASCDAETGK